MECLLDAGLSPLCLLPLLRLLLFCLMQSIPAILYITSSTSSSTPIDYSLAPFHYIINADLLFHRYHTQLRRINALDLSTTHGKDKRKSSSVIHIIRVTLALQLSSSSTSHIHSLVASGSARARTVLHPPITMFWHHREKSDRLTVG